MSMAAWVYFLLPEKKGYALEDTTYPFEIFGRFAWGTCVPRRRAGDAWGRNGANGRCSRFEWHCRRGTKRAHCTYTSSRDEGFSYAGERLRNVTAHMHN
ncbi:hypothetical protein BDR03DRAFT_119938 [Suillus americanus]|nr:hypothetical protein BDR03DRAFT_119938 [Suillus americanus]